LVTVARNRQALPLAVVALRLEWYKRLFLRRRPIPGPDDGGLRSSFEPSEKLGGKPFQH
jgi:hypothetical protein